MKHDERDNPRCNSPDTASLREMLMETIRALFERERVMLDSPVVGVMLTVLMPDQPILGRTEVVHATLLSGVSTVSDREFSRRAFQTILEDCLHNGLDVAEIHQMVDKADETTLKTTTLS